MARFFRRGVSKITWVAALGNEAAPTVAELNGGQDLSTLVGITGFVGPTNQPIELRPYDQTHVDKIPGEDTSEDGTITFAEDDTGTTAEWDALTKGDEGFICFSPIGIAATNPVDVFPSQVSAKRRLYEEGNVEGRVQAQFAIRSEPTIDADIAA